MKTIEKQKSKQKKKKKMFLTHPHNSQAYQQYLPFLHPSNLKYTFQVQANQSNILFLSFLKLQRST